MKKLQAIATQWGTRLGPVLSLTLRILIGYALFRAGYGKFQNAEQTATFFEGLGIPAAQANVYLVATVEALGGLFIMIGLFTRLSSIAVIGALGVAMLTAHRAELTEFFSNPGGTIGAAPVPYLVLCIFLFIYGPGRLSVDHSMGEKG